MGVGLLGGGIRPPEQANTGTRNAGEIRRASYAKHDGRILMKNEAYVKYYFQKKAGDGNRRLVTGR
jgi:hypothetical protein